MTLKSLYQIFANHPEGLWIMRPENAEALYNLIKNNSIHRVLDLGTGIGLSAAVAALAFQDKGETAWHIDTVEQYDKCIDLARQLIPSELKQNITFLKSDPCAIQIDGIPYQYFSTYKDLLIGDYDLIVNDGPSPFVENDKYIDLPNGTIHLLTTQNQIKPGTKVAYDGRKQSFNLIERYFSANYSLISIPPRGQDFYVIERKDNELEVGDEILEAMKIQTSYFKNHEKNIIPDNQPSTSGQATTSSDEVKE